ncbi:MAG: hypothetical protein E6Q40_07610 [Cupriavidus sp.]|nr:MAG: hypothetical protein E6Q40_07610 [Cupriavidus sp.]
MSPPPFYTKVWNAILGRLKFARQSDLDSAIKKQRELAADLQRAEQAIVQRDAQIASLTILRNQEAAVHSRTMTQRDSLELEVARAKWCRNALVCWPGNTPQGLATNTAQYLKAIVRSAKDYFALLRPDNYSSPEQWALYWSLAGASQGTQWLAGGKQNENALSNAFIQKLASEAQEASKLLGANGHLSIAYSCIYDQTQGALQEVHVGADLLVIVAGQTLIPHGWAKVFWVQAKRAVANRPLALDYGHKNTQGRQVEALAMMHEPSKGAFAYYIQYAGGLQYIPAVSVDQLDRGSNTRTADLSAIGARLAEKLVAEVANASGGAFANPGELLQYLQVATGHRPTYVVAIEDGDRGLARERTMDLVVDYYRRELGLEQTLAEPASGRERDRADEDDYPAPRP